LTNIVRRFLQSAIVRSKKAGIALFIESLLQPNFYGEMEE
jgi:hypothetical protein